MSAEPRNLRPHSDSVRASCLVVIPALNEQETIAGVVNDLRRRGFQRIRVIDNGSTDRTAEYARAAGAEVHNEPHCGYGRACQRGLSNIPRGIAWILFCDGDGSDDFDDVDLMIETAERGADLILTNRFATKSGREAMTLMQRFGNQLIVRLNQLGWKFRFTDFGPLRLIRRESLDDIAMRTRLWLERRDANSCCGSWIDNRAGASSISATPGRLLKNIRKFSRCGLRGHRNAAGPSEALLRRAALRCAG